MIPQLNSNNDRQDVRKEDRVERGGGGQGEAMHSRNTEMDLGGERPTRTRSDNENENPFDDEVNKSTTGEFWFCSLLTKGFRRAHVGEGNRPS